MARFGRRCTEQTNFHLVAKCFLAGQNISVLFYHINILSINIKKCILLFIILCIPMFVMYQCKKNILNIKRYHLTHRNISMCISFVLVEINITLSFRHKDFNKNNAILAHELKFSKNTFIFKKLTFYF